MEKKKTRKTVKVDIEIRTMPMYVGKMQCPYCDAPQLDYFEESEQGKVVLNRCDSCKEDFYIDIPNF